MNTVMVREIPAALRVRDVCRELAISRSQFYRLFERLRAMGVLVEVVPRLDAHPRYQGAPIAQFLGADGQKQQLQRSLRKAG